MIINIRNIIFIVSHWNITCLLNAIKKTNPLCTFSENYFSNDGKIDNHWVRHSVMKTVDAESFKEEQTPNNEANRKKDFEMEFLEEVTIEKTQNIWNNTSVVQFAIQRTQKCMIFILMHHKLNTFKMKRILVFSVVWILICLLQMNMLQNMLLCHEVHHLYHVTQLVIWIGSGLPLKF